MNRMGRPWSFHAHPLKRIISPWKSADLDMIQATNSEDDPVKGKPSKKNPADIEGVGGEAAFGFRRVF